MQALRRCATGALCVLLPFVALGCGSSSKNTQSQDNAGTGVTTPLTSAPPSGGAASCTEKKTKPTVTKPTTPAPTSLVKNDLTVGTGATAQAGQTVTVQYLGVDYATGQQFDASWDRGQPFSFQLGAGAVIPGWDQGVPGMKVCGRRELIIPPALGYGAAGNGAVKPNATLIFVVDLISVQ